MDLTMARRPNQWGCSSYLLGVKKAVLVPLRMFSLKRFIFHSGSFFTSFQGVEPRRGSRGGEMGEFSPPLFLSPLLSFFLIPQILTSNTSTRLWFFYIITKIHTPFQNPGSTPGAILVQNWYLQGVKKFQATPTKQDLGTPFGIPFRNSNEQPRPFYMGVSPTQGFNPHFCLQIFIFANEFYKHVHCHTNQTHFDMKGWAPGLVFQLSQHLLRTLQQKSLLPMQRKPGLQE